MNLWRSCLVGMWIGLTLDPSLAHAQNRGVQTVAQVSILRLDELHLTRVGVGPQVAWPLTSAVAIDGAFTWFPGAHDLGADLLKSQERILGLAGLRAVIIRGDVELFARARAGFLRFGKLDSVGCILIFPEPLGCQLATGYTAFAADFGGAAIIGLGTTGRLRVHIEAGDLLVRYGLQARRPRGEITNGFVGHNPLVSLGLGWQF